MADPPGKSDAFDVVRLFGLRVFLIAGVLPFVLYLVVIFGGAAFAKFREPIKRTEEPREKKNLGGQGKIEKIEILNARGDGVREWSSDNAVQFGLGQAADSVKYLLVATTALLGFVARLLVDPIIKPQEVFRASLPALLFLVNAAAGCLFSLIFGIFANWDLALVATNRRFSMYGTFGLMAALQQMCFLAAVLWFIVGIFTELLRQLKARNEVSIPGASREVVQPIVMTSSDGGGQSREESCL